MFDSGFEGLRNKHELCGYISAPIAAVTEQTDVYVLGEGSGCTHVLDMHPQSASFSKSSVPSDVL